MLLGESRRLRALEVELKKSNGCSCEKENLESPQRPLSLNKCSGNQSLCSQEPCARTSVSISTASSGWAVVPGSRWPPAEGFKDKSVPVECRTIGEEFIASSPLSPGS